MRGPVVSAIYSIREPKLDPLSWITKYGMLLKAALEDSEIYCLHKKGAI